jgi:hypothetical protein
MEAGRNQPVGPLIAPPVPFQRTTFNLNLINERSRRRLTSETTQELAGGHVGALCHHKNTAAEIPCSA